MKDQAILRSDGTPMLAGGCLGCGKPEKEQSLETGFGGYRRLICRGCGNEVDLSSETVREA